MADQSIRGYLGSLEQHGELIRFTDAVDPHANLTAIGWKTYDRLGKASLFANLTGFPGWRAVNQIVTDRRKWAIALGVDEDDVVDTFTRRVRAPLPAVEVVASDAPVKAVIEIGDDADLTRIPAAWTSEEDPGPYIAAGMAIIKDPDTGVRNMSIHRQQVLGPRSTGYLICPRQAQRIYQKYQARGEPMPVAVAIGAHPALYFAAAYTAPYGTDELSVAGALIGEPVRLVRCETVDLEVPATAELVIEGEIAIETVEPEGPFGEFTGYMAGGRECPVFRATCITHRKDPILLGIVSQFPPSESSQIKRALLEAGLKKHLSVDLNIPGITDVHALEAGGCTATLWISLDKMYAGHVDQAVFGAMGYFGMSYFKWIVVTDDDIDINDAFMRDWILAWRVRPEQDIRIIPNTAPVELDPSSLRPDIAASEATGAKVIIDATRKWDYPDISLPPLDRLRDVAADWDAYGLPPLDELRLPRSG